MEAAPSEPPEYETPPVFAPEELLPLELIAGPHHYVDDEVVNDGYTNHYMIQSDFGPFAAPGRELLEVRVQEIRAIAILREMKKSEAYRKGMQKSLKDAALAPFRQVKKMVTNPLYAVMVVPGEVGRAVSIFTDVRKLVQSGFNKKYFHDLIGFTSAKRELARRLEVDRNSPNPVLQEDLNDVAWAFYAGGAPLRLADRFMPSLGIPHLELVEGGGSIGEAVDTVVDEVKPKSTRKKLRRMGVGHTERKKFMHHPVYSPRRRRALVKALHEIEDADDRDAYIALALEAESEEETVALQRRAEMLAAYHARVTPITRIIVVDEFGLALTEDDKVIVPLFFDHLVWTQEVAQRMGALQGGKPAGVTLTGQEIWISGAASTRTHAEFADLGFAVTENAFSVLEEFEESRQAEEAEADKEKKEAAAARKRERRLPRSSARPR